MSDPEEIEGDEIEHAVRCDCGRLLGRAGPARACTRCKRCKRDVALDLASGLLEHRCRCGRLLARRVPAGLELCCPRCKRRVVMVAAEHAPP